MTVALYMDEQVASAITRGLRRRGIDVLRVQDDGHRSTDDEIILDRAAALNRVVFTQDDDFLAIAQQRQASGVPFAGVVYARQRGPTIGRCITHLELVAGGADMAYMANRVEYILT